MLYYNRYSERSQEEGTWRYTEAEAILSFSLPKLPSLHVTYNREDNFGSEDSEVWGDDTTDTLTVRISYPIKRARVSFTHLRSDYKDRTEFPSRESIVSNVYGVSVPWGRYLTLSTNYRDSDTRDLLTFSTTTNRYVTLGMNYKIIPNKLTISGKYKTQLSENTVDKRKIITNLTLTYYPTKKSVLQLSDQLTNYDNFLSGSAWTYDNKNLSFTYNYILTENLDLKLKYNLSYLTDFTYKTTSQNSDIRLTCNYKF